MQGRIVLVRHGETEWSREGRHTGRTDLPLTAAGEQAARSLAPRLPDHVDLVLCSPLQRARRTAELAGLVVTATDPDLVEWDYGAWEGRTTAEIRASLGDPHWVIWDHAIPPGSTPGEQPTDVALRAERVLARCRPVVDAGGTCVLVAHGHVLRILTACWLGLAPVDGRLFGLDPATLSVLGHEHDQQVIRSWNAQAPLAR